MQTDEMKYIVYVAINQLDGKKYVGFTKRGLERRKAIHERDALANSPLYFHRAIRKYGPESFKWYIVGWSASDADIKSQEIAHIKFYKSVGEELYNMTGGGEGVTNSTPEVRAKQAASGRISGHIGGRISGRMNVESGHLTRITTPESCAKGGRISGHIQGRKGVESGHLARIRELPQSKAAQRASGLRAVESGQLARITTPESCAKGGRAGIESGHLTRIRELPQTKAAQRANGLKQVARMLELPQTRAAQHAFGHRGHLGRHVRWHENRGLVKLDCKLCNPNVAQISTQAVAA
jgi:hypothetical protein